MTTALSAFAAALAAGTSLPDDPALGWAALDAAGLGGGFRAAVRAAGGPLSVLAQGAVASFTSPRRRRRILEREAIAQRLALLGPFLGDGGAVIADDDSLARLADHPVFALYGRARLPTAARPHIAIVGSREAAAATLARTARLAGRLASAGAVVVSGGACGVDTAAAEGARDVGGDVVVISGRAVGARVEGGDDPRVSWVTPYGPWAPGIPSGRYAQRNAYIAAMADVVVAVCGGPRSGTRHTVLAALQLGRPVVTIVGEADEPALGALGALLVGSDAGVVVPDDVDLTTLLRATAPPGAHARFAGALAQGRLGPLQRALPLAVAPLDVAHPVVRLLARRGALPIDDVAAALAQSVRELMADVALLEIDGAVRRDGALLALAHVDGGG